MNTFFAITCLFAGLFVSDAAEIESLSNLAKGKSARQSSTYKNAFASRAVDDNWDSNWKQNSCTHTDRDRNPWWEVDLGQDYDVYAVFIKNREDCCAERLAKIKVTVDGKLCNYQESAVRSYTLISCETALSGRKVRIQLQQSSQYLTLCEVNVIGL